MSRGQAQRTPASTNGQSTSTRPTVQSTSAKPPPVKFGPSAWYANEQDRHWVRTVDRGDVDYECIFLARAESREVRQSAVTLREVLDGLQLRRSPVARRDPRHVQTQHLTHRTIRAVMQSSAATGQSTAPRCWARLGPSRATESFRRLSTIRSAAVEAYGRSAAWSDVLVAAVGWKIGCGRAQLGAGRSASAGRSAMPVAVTRRSRWTSTLVT